jgi:hypothetical protein
MRVMRLRSRRQWLTDSILTFSEHWRMDNLKKSPWSGGCLLDMPPLQSTSMGMRSIAGTHVVCCIRCTLCISRNNKIVWHIHEYTGIKRHVLHSSTNDFQTSLDMLKKYPRATDTKTDLFSRRVGSKQEQCWSPCYTLPTTQNEHTTISQWVDYVQLQWIWISALWRDYI